MRTFIVCSTFAHPKKIHANDDRAAIRHYVKAHLLNGGGPIQSPGFRVYDDDAPTVR